MGKLSIESDGKTIGRYCGNNMPTNVFSTRGSLTLKIEETFYRNRYTYKKFTTFISNVMTMNVLLKFY